MSRTTIAGVALVALAPVAALTAPAASADGASPTDARRAASYKVIAKVNKTVVIAKEDTVKVRGRVKPRAAGQKVILQQRVGDKKRWRKTDTARIKRSGRFVLKDKPSTAGEREYRVVKPATRGVRRGVSKAMDVTVYAWERLAFRRAGATSGVEVLNANIATEGYYPSLVGTTPGTAGYTEYTLGKKCTSLRATYALDDRSATGTTGSVTVSTDGTARAAFPLSVGTIEADHEMDVTDVFRLRFDMTSTGNATAGAYPAVGLPEVLCTR